MDEPQDLSKPFSFLFDLMLRLIEQNKTKQNKTKQNKKPQVGHDGFNILIPDTWIS